MTERNERDELVELMSRYATMADTKDWGELPATVFCEQFTSDFTAFGAPSTTLSREAWCRQSRRTFAGWVATHHAITNHRIAVDGDRATIRAHVRAEHWAPADVAAGGPNCWLVVGFYDNVAVRTPDGWRLSSIRLTPVYQENSGLVAATMAAVTAPVDGQLDPDAASGAPAGAHTLAAGGRATSLPAGRVTPPE